MIKTILAGAAGVSGALIGSALVHRKLGQRSAARMLRTVGVRGIAEERFIRIGGIDQWIGIRGEDRDNPVLLVIHGGPGFPGSLFTPVMRPWENYFTIVQWDQRGAGRTLGRTGRDGSGELTFDRLVRDGIEVAEFVESRFPTNQIIVFGSSFGSLIGLDMVSRRPELFGAYVGTDQNVGMARSHEKIYRETIARLREAGVTKGVRALEKMGPDVSSWSAKEHTASAQWTMQSDPPTRAETLTLLKQAIWFSPGFSLADIKNVFAGMHFSMAKLLPEITTMDAWRLGTRFEVPFFLIQGENDVLTPPSLAQQYFAEVTAPVKEMAIVPGAGHFAAFTHPEEALEELRSRVLPLATAPGLIGSRISG